MSAQGANDPGGDSPFAILLAASAQQAPAPQTGAVPPADGDIVPATATADAQDNAAAAVVPPMVPPLPQDSQGQPASTEDGKPAKPIDDKDRDGNVARGPVQPFAQVAAALVSDPAIAHIIQQKPGTVPDAGGPDAANTTPPGIARVAEKAIGWASRIGTGDPGDNGANAQDGQVAAEPANDDPVLAASIPSPVQITDDDASSDAPAAQDKPDDIKPATGKSVDSKPADNPSAVTQPDPQPGNDALAISQIVMTAPPAGASAIPPAPSGGREDAPPAQIAQIAPPQAEKPETNNSEPAGKAPQAPDAAPAAINAPVAPTAPDGKKDAKSADSVKTASGNDTKPLHIAAADAAPQPDAPAPVQHAAPAPVLPQNLAATGFDAPNPVTGDASTMATTSLHLANADADPTPNLDALAVSIAARSLSGAKQFEIRLDPPELGRVDVRLSIDASGKTQAHMTADQPQTLDLLQKDAPTLTQALRDAGLDVSQGGLNFSLRGQDRQNDDGGNGGAPGRRTNLTASRTIQAAQGPAAISFNGAAADARLDIHV